MTSSNNSNITIFDGGTGREIERCGGPFRQPEWSALCLYEDPSIVQRVHSAFLQAGATAITTNTYAIVPFHIGEERYRNDGKRLLELAIQLARQAVDEYRTQQPTASSQQNELQILGSIPPLCGSYEPNSFQETKVGNIMPDFLSAFCGSVDKDATVDVLLLETVGSLREAQYYLREIQDYNREHKKQQQPLPVWLSFCVKTEYGDNQQPTLLTGEGISESIEVLHKEGLLDGQVAVIMVNCCDLRLVKDSIVEIQSTLQKIGPSIQVGCYPNAFSIPPPDAANQTLRQVDYNISPQVLKCQATKWIDAGATVLGGCCGVNPDHIRAMASLICQPAAKADLSEEASNNTAKQNAPQQPRRVATTSTVFVTGLAPAVSKIHVEKMFGKFGQVLRVDMKTSQKTGATFCFVELDSVENAQRAMDNLNGRMLLHKRLVVQPANERRESGQPVTVAVPTDPVREGKSLDKKIDLLKQKIKDAANKK